MLYFAKNPCRSFSVQQSTETSAGYPDGCVHKPGQKTHRWHFLPHQVGTGAGTCPAKAAAALQHNRGTEHGSPSWPCTLCPHLLPLLLSAGNLLLGRLNILKSLSPVFRGIHEVCCLKGFGRTRPAPVGTQDLPGTQSFYLQGEYCSCSGQPSGC